MVFCGTFTVWVCLSLALLGLISLLLSPLDLFSGFFHSFFRFSRLGVKYPVLWGVLLLISLVQDLGLVLLAFSSFLSGVLLASVGLGFCTVKSLRVFLFILSEPTLPWKVFARFASGQDFLCDLSSLGCLSHFCRLRILAQTFIALAILVWVFFPCWHQFCFGLKHFFPLSWIGFQNR